SGSLDGYSLTMDFPLNEDNQASLTQLTKDFTELLLFNKGKVYLAEDTSLESKTVREMFGEEDIQTLKQLKNFCDPENLIQSDLYRRIFSDLLKF
ncbi:MAG: hypothetical protein KDK45_19365, partial [Leptospiraceae bacterium]|nr:hypothetical protein [Leptospiraceae bacterium]